MKPLLKREIDLNLYYLKAAPIDVVKAVMLLQAIEALKNSAFPIHLTVNQFRALIGALPHCDERGTADCLDLDESRPGDDTITPELLQQAWDYLVANNQGGYQRGELHDKYPELVAVLNIPRPQ